MGGFGMDDHLLTCMRWAAGVLVRCCGGATGHSHFVLVKHPAAVCTRPGLTAADGLGREASIA